MQATLIEKWRGYFFAPSEPFNLGMCRLLITGTYLVSLLIPEAAIGAEFVELARLPHYAWHPHSYYRLFDNYPLSPDVTSVLYWGWLGALLCTALGFYTRTSSAIAALLTIFFGGMVFNFTGGRTGHNAVLFFLWVVCLQPLSRAGDAASLDSFLLRRTGNAPRPSPSGEYTWPIRGLWVMYGVMFTAGGIAKLRKSGLEWVTSESLKHWLVARAGYSYHEPIIDVGALAWDWPRVTMGLAAGALTIELLAILTPFFSWARRSILPGLFFMQLGIALFMGVHFVSFTNYLSFVDWRRWALRFGLLQRGPQEVPSSPSTAAS